MIFPPSLSLISVLTLIKSSFSTTIELAPVGEPAPGGNVYHSIRFPGEVRPYNHPLTTSQSATITSPANASHIRTSSAAPAKSTAASHRGAGDPCGPQGNQTDFESTLNTCSQINTTYTHAPSIYGVQCLNANPSWNQSINTTSCASNIDNICGSIISNTTTVSQWNWSSGGPNCTVGVWFNPLPAAPLSVSRTTCQHDMYQLMQSTCFPSQGGQFNVAAVNLQTLPDVDTNGSQVDSGYPSYIIVPQTYNAIYTETPPDDEMGGGDVAGGGEENGANGDEDAADGDEDGPDGENEGES